MVNLQTATTVAGEAQPASAPTPTPVNAAAPQAAAATPVVQPAPAAAAQREPSTAELKKAVKQLETFMQSMNRYLEFRIDQDSGRTVVTVKDTTTGDVIRQIPSEEVLRLAQNLGGKAPTALVSQTA